MSQNKEELKNKIFYRASYRGTKEMDMLMTAFVNSIISELNFEKLQTLNKLVNMNDEDLILIRKKKLEDSIYDKTMTEIITKFKITYYIIYSLYGIEKE